MRKALRCGFGLLAVVLPALDAAAATEKELKAQVVAQEKAWSDAVIRHEAAKVAAILSDDFIGIDGRGVVSDKAAELKEAEPLAADSPAPRLVREDHSDIKVRLYGDLAVLTMINAAHFATKEKETQIKYRRTTVWKRESGTWRCVSFHGSRILEPPPKP